MSNDPKAATAKFELRIGRSGTNRDEWRVLGTYDNGKDAADAKGETQCEEGFVLAIVRVSLVAEGDLDWREREASRFEQGRYKRVLFDEMADGYIDAGGYNLAGYYPDHFAHVAESDSAKIAFTESEEKGRKDIQKVMSYTDYLARYYSETFPAPWGIKPSLAGGHAPYVGVGTQRHLAELCAGISTEVHFASTADEIERIYVLSGGTSNEKSSCGSCMGYETSRYNSGGIHPTRAYAAGDIMLAYLLSNEGGLIARCLVWPEKLVGGRIYGHQGSALKTALRAKGYTNVGDYDALAGARMLKIPVPGYNDRFVVPYIDGNDQKFRDDGEFFVIDRDGDQYGHSTDGYVTMREIIKCDRCSEDCVDEDGDESAYSVGEATWCYGCYEGHTSRCGHCDENFDDEEVTFTEVHYRSGWSSRPYYTRDVCSTCLDNYTETSADVYYPSRDVSPCETCGDLHLDSDLDHNSHCDACAEATDDSDDSETIEETVVETVEALETVEPATSVSSDIDWSLPVFDTNRGTWTRANALSEADLVNGAVWNVNGWHYRNDGTHAYNCRRSITQPQELDAGEVFGPYASFPFA